MVHRWGSIGINLKKNDPDLKWPDIMESWESLTTGVVQILKGTSVYIVGDSTEINEKVARELSVGFGYTPLNTRELLETFAKQTIDSYESKGYSNAQVIVKFGEWLPNQSQTVSQACLSALKRLILSDKKLPGKKNLYIKLGCRGDWPNINTPGWDLSAGDDVLPGTWHLKHSKPNC